jgi:hypothetical protein
MRPKTLTLLTSLAAIVLVATAGFHATGYRSLSASVMSSAISPFFQKALPGIWLFFSWHLVALALGLVWATLRVDGSMRSLVRFIAILVCVDTLFVLWVAGVFAGTILLAGAAVCLVIASLRWPAA